MWPSKISGSASLPESVMPDAKADSSVNMVIMTSMSAKSNERHIHQLQGKVCIGIYQFTQNVLILTSVCLQYCPLAEGKCSGIKINSYIHFPKLLSFIHNLVHYNNTDYIPTDGPIIRSLIFDFSHNSLYLIFRLHSTLSLRTLLPTSYVWSNCQTVWH